MAFKNSWIKCLIWLGFLFVSSAITTGLAYAGVLLGGVPTILLFAVACYAARSCCKAYDRKHAPLPSVADTGEEPKSASLADGAAAEEPAERQENREEAKMGEILSSLEWKVLMYYLEGKSQERAAGAACQGEQPAPRLAEAGHSYSLGTGGRAYCILLLARVSSAMRAGKSVGCKQIHPGGVFLPPNG